MKDFFEASEVLEKPMEAFFDKVFVMAEDEKARNSAKHIAVAPPLC